MPTQSDNYGLWVGMVTDDFIEPAHVDRAAQIVDRVLGGVVGKLLAAGVYEGWLLGQDKQVGAGWGVLEAAIGETEAGQEIGGLTNEAVNYVFAVATEETAPGGVVGFAAQTGSVGPAGALYLGTIELDAAGAVVALDNDATGVDRGVFPLVTRTLQGSGTVAEVDPDETVAIEVTHAALAVPGAIAVTVSEGFSYVVEEAWRGDGLLVKATNEGTETAELVYAWERKGMG